MDNPEKIAAEIFSKIKQAYNDSIAGVEDICDRYSLEILGLFSTLTEDYTYSDIDVLNKKSDKLIQRLQIDLAELYLDSFYDLLPKHFASYSLVLSKFSNQIIPARHYSALPGDELDALLSDIVLYLAAIGSDIKRSLYDTLISGVALGRNVSEILSEIRAVVTKNYYRAKIKNLFYISFIKHSNKISQLLNKKYGITHEWIISLNEEPTNRLVRDIHKEDYFEVRVSKSDENKMLWLQQNDKSLRYYGLVPPSMFGSQEIILPKIQTSGK